MNTMVLWSHDTHIHQQQDDVPGVQRTETFRDTHRQNSIPRLSDTLYAEVLDSPHGFPVGTDGNRVGLLRRSLFLLAISAFLIRSSRFW